MEIKWAVTAADRAAAFRLRYDVYVVEMKYYLGWADHGHRRLSDRFDDGAHVLLAREGETVVGTLRVHFGAEGAIPKEWREDFGIDEATGAVAEAKVAVLTRLVVASDHRGSFAPLLIMQEAFRLGSARGVELALLDCVPHLVGLYRRLGFRRYRSAVNDPETGLLIPMGLALRSRKHLERVSSPFCELIALETPEPPWSEAFFVGDDREAGGMGAELTRERFAQGLLASLSDAELAHVLKDAEIIDAKQGAVVIRQGAVSRSLFVVLDGTVEVRRNDVTLAVLGAGECLGEMNFLRCTERSCDVAVTSTRGTLVSLSERRVRKLVELQPALAARLYLNLATVLAERLARAHEFIS